jgi:hypothetical protein
MAEGRKAIPAPKGLQPNLSSTKTGIVCRFMSVSMIRME